MHELIAFVVGVLFGFGMCFLKLGFWIGVWKVMLFGPPPKRTKDA